MARGEPLLATVVTTGPDETRAFGERLAQKLRPGSVVFLYGDLGSGKTTLAQGIVRGLGCDVWANSPSFTLINEYAGRMKVYHCDFYRLRDPTELDTLPLDEIFYGNGVAVVEWPEIAEAWGPPEVIRVRIIRTGRRKRRIEIDRPIDL